MGVTGRVQVQSQKGPVCHRACVLHGSSHPLASGPPSLHRTPGRSCNSVFPAPPSLPAASQTTSVLQQASLFYDKTNMLFLQNYNLPQSPGIQRTLQNPLLTCSPREHQEQGQGLPAPEGASACSGAIPTGSAVMLIIAKLPHSDSGHLAGSLERSLQISGGGGIWWQGHDPSQSGLLLWGPSIFFLSAGMGSGGWLQN